MQFYLSTAQFLFKSQLVYNYFLIVKRRLLLKRKVTFMEINGKNYQIFEYFDLNMYVSVQKSNHRRLKSYSNVNAAE